MIDPPDYIVMARPGAFPRWPDFPHCLLLLPEGRTAASVLNEPGFSAVYLVEHDAGSDALNSAALEGYIASRVPLRFYARRARDLRPILRRREAMQRRGWLVEVVR